MCAVGVNLGITAVHPFSGQPIPVFAADYVISGYGAKAVMGVPAHDSRDKLFADQHALPCIAVNKDGVLLNSDQVLKCFSSGVF